MADKDFYDIDHEGQRLRLPRVTSMLRIIDRSNALIGWATRLERDAFKAALEDLLTEPGALDPQKVWDRVQPLLNGRRAWIKARDAAADIGREAHDWIRWETYRRMGLDGGPEPELREPAWRACAAWMDWARDHDFQPLHAEKLVYCPDCAYAGTMDGLGLVDGKAVVVDYKTGKAIYDEAHLQVRAYRHAAAREGLTTDGGLILRLPKTAKDPDFEAVPAAEIPYKYWIYVMGAWRWQRIMEGDEYGSLEMRKCEVAA